MASDVSIELSPQVAAPRAARSRPRPWRQVILQVVMFAAAAAYLVPLGFVVSSSLRTDANMYDPTQWIPNPATLAHYANLLNSLPDLPRYVLNTVFIAVVSTVGTLISSALAGYGLARFRFRGRAVVLATLLVTLMIPAQVTLVPLFTLFRQAGLTNSPWPIIIPTLFGTPFVTFFFRQYFLGLPREFDEAARVDGASWPRVFLQIVVPLSKPAFVTMGLLTLIAQWNGYFWPSVYLKHQSQWVLTQAMVSLTGQYTSRQGEIMAGILLMSLPMIVLFVVGQRWVVQSLTSSGVKG